MNTQQVTQTQSSYCVRADVSFLALARSFHGRDLLIVKSDVMIPDYNHKLSRNWVLKHFPKSPDIICPRLHEKN